MDKNRDNFKYALLREASILKTLQRNQSSLAILHESKKGNITTRTINISLPESEDIFTQVSYDENGNIQDPHLVGKLEILRVDIIQIFSKIRKNEVGSSEIIDTSPFIYGEKEDTKTSISIKEGQEFINFFWEREGDPSVYSQGLCGTFALALTNIFKDTKLWGVGPKGNATLHFFAQIGDFYMDSTGVFETVDGVGEGTDLEDPDLGESYGGEIVKERVNDICGESFCEITGKTLQEELLEILAKVKANNSIISTLDNEYIAEENTQKMKI